MGRVVLFFAIVLSSSQIFGNPIINGDKAIKLGQEKYKFVVYLEINDRLKEQDDADFCGGSIIQKGIVLTAAHCITQYSHETEIYAVAGIVNLKTEKRKAQVRKMYDYKIHERYLGFTVKKDNGVTYAKHNQCDIALIWLVEPFIFNEKVSKIPLMPPNSQLDGKQGYIVGWGVTETGYSPNDLRSANVKIVAKSECEYVKRGTHFIIDKGMLCTKPVNQISQQCSGDSGGPYIIDNKLAGIISNSVLITKVLQNGKQVKVTDPEEGAVVTNVAIFNDWILENQRLGPPRDRVSNKPDGRPQNSNNNNPPSKKDTPKSTTKATKATKDSQKPVQGNQKPAQTPQKPNNKGQKPGNKPKNPTKRPNTKKN